MNQKQRILIVDDKQHVCTTLAIHLQPFYDVKACLSVESGLQELRADLKNHPKPSERYAVLLADLRFDNFQAGTAPHDEKERAGYYLMREAKNDKFLEVILMTAHGDEKAAETALEAGVYRYVPKGGAGDFNVNKLWIETLSRTVKSAAAARSRWLSLHEDLDLMERISRSLQSQPMTERDLTTLSIALQDARKNYETLLKSRGHTD